MMGYLKGSGDEEVNVILLERSTVLAEMQYPVVCCAWHHSPDLGRNQTHNFHSS